SGLGRNGGRGGRLASDSCWSLASVDGELAEDARRLCLLTSSVCSICALVRARCREIRMSSVGLKVAGIIAGKVVRKRGKNMEKYWGRRNRCLFPSQDCTR